MKIKKFDSINVIPFIDVLLVLLAIVLMTSTFIAKGVIPVSLPKASSSEVKELKKEIVFYIKKDGSIYLDKKLLLKEDLEQEILSLKKEDQVLINSDKDSKFDVFISLFDLLKQNDFENISIVTIKQ